MSPPPLTTFGNISTPTTSRLRSKVDLPSTVSVASGKSTYATTSTKQIGTVVSTSPLQNGGSIGFGTTSMQNGGNSGFGTTTITTGGNVAGSMKSAGSCAFGTTTKQSGGSYGFGTTSMQSGGTSKFGTTTVQSGGSSGFGARSMQSGGSSGFGTTTVQTGGSIGFASPMYSAGSSGFAAMSTQDGGTSAFGTLSAMPTGNSWGSGSGSVQQFSSGGSYSVLSNFTTLYDTSASYKFGKGRHSDVIKARSKTDSRDVAVKVLSINSLGESKVRQEVSAMAAVSHKYFAHMVDACQ